MIPSQIPAPTPKPDTPALIPPAGTVGLVLQRGRDGVRWEKALPPPKKWNPWFPIARTARIGFRIPQNLPRNGAMRQSLGPPATCYTAHIAPIRLRFSFSDLKPLGGMPRPTIVKGEQCHDSVRECHKIPSEELSYAQVLQ